MSPRRALAYTLIAASLSACAQTHGPITVEDLPPPDPFAGGNPMDIASACPLPPKQSDDGIGGTGCPTM